MAVDPKFIRNFSIVAHIDHGKSTLADQLLLQSGAITQREFREQLLDDMDLERERGITIKARAVAINYTLDGQIYELNLIDTPGHVDFHYEVSRSLAACEGAILLVDATQGVQAQTVANAYLAVNNNLAIVPVLNKIDMQACPARGDQGRDPDQPGDRPRPKSWPSAPRPGRACPTCFGRSSSESRIPPAIPQAPLRALIFDSKFDDYQGVITYVRVVDGTLRVGQSIRLMAEGRDYEVTGLGRFRPREVACEELGVGQVGYVIANIKQLSDIRDRRYDHPDAAAGPGGPSGLSGARAGCLLRALSGHAQPVRRPAHRLQKLALNDSSFTFEPESSDALGFGFRCGFLGMLHMEIVQQRLERESNLVAGPDRPDRDLRDPHPRGARRCTSRTRPESPTPASIEEFREPISRLNFIIPSDSIGAIMQLCEDRRGVFIKTEYLSPSRAILTYELPLAEMIYDLYDKLKSATRGYGTMDYEVIGYRAGDLCRLDILVAGQRVDALSTVVHRAHADRRGRKLVKKLKGEIERHQFEVAIQAAIGSRVIARENDLGAAKERHRQVLWRRHHPKTQASRKAKRGQETYETGRERRDLAGRVPLGPR